VEIPLKAFLLCAGQGTRFYPHTQILPKVLIPFLNLPIVAYNIFLLKMLGVTDIIANVHGIHHQTLAQNLKKISTTAGLQQIAISHEQQLLGAAGGLLQIQDFILSSKSQNKTDFYYLNGDSFILSLTKDQIQNFYSTHKKSGALVSFLCCPSLQKKSVLWADHQHQVRAFGTTTDNRLQAYHFCGLALFSYRIFQEIAPGMTHIFQDVLHKKCLTHHLRIHPVDPLITLDMNQLSPYLQGTETALKYLFHSSSEDTFLHQTLNMFSPHWKQYQGERYISATPMTTSHWKDTQDNPAILFCGQHVQGLPHAQIKHYAVLGNHCRILSTCQQIYQSVVDQHVSISHNISNSLML